MDLIELTELIDKGETSRVQFKRRFDHARQVAAEIAAFANTDGGKILVGVEDNGNITGISSEDFRRLNQYISNACKDNIDPPLSVKVDSIKYKSGRLVPVIDVPMGPNKFYIANGNEIWVKAGADKRKASREEMKRLLQESGNISADESPVFGTSIYDLNRDLYLPFIEKRAGVKIDELIESQQLRKMLENLKLMKDNACTICGMVLFQEKPLIDKISSAVKMISFAGNEFAADNYRDKEEINSDIASVYKAVMSFFDRHLKKIQIGDNPNSKPVWEIPETALQESLVNALVHRNYFLRMNVRIMVYDNRVELFSPGTLPNTLTVESIKMGISNHRNPNIISNVKDIPEIPYTGLGMGITRILTACRNNDIEVDFINDTDTCEFKVIFWRK